MASYKVKEIFYTLQGEGYHTGRPAVFCRFTGCNLWTGREKDRHKAVCQFCDTDFVGTDGTNGGVFRTAAALAEAIYKQWPSGSAGKPFVVCTGGEPLLQMDKKLVDAIHDKGIEIAIESNGTIQAPEGIDWVCISPKAGSELVQLSGDELKLVYPQPGAEPGKYEHLDFTHFYLQPKDDIAAQSNVRLTIEYCMDHPQWKLSIQTHKWLNIR